jgi:hypothetical protein
MSTASGSAAALHEYREARLSVILLDSTHQAMPMLDRSPVVRLTLHN